MECVSKIYSKALLQQIEEINIILDRQKLVKQAAENQEPFKKLQMPFNPMTVQSQNQFFEKELEVAELKLKDLQESDLNDENIKRLQDENRKYISRKIENQRARLQSNKDKLYQQTKEYSKLSLIYQKQQQIDAYQQHAKSDRGGERDIKIKSSLQNSSNSNKLTIINTASSTPQQKLPSQNRRHSSKNSRR